MARQETNQFKNQGQSEGNLLPGSGAGGRQRRGRNGRPPRADVWVTGISGNQLLA